MGSTHVPSIPPLLTPAALAQQIDAFTPLERLAILEGVVAALGVDGVRTVIRALVASKTLHHSRSQIQVPT